MGGQGSTCSKPKVPPQVSKVVDPGFTADLRPLHKRYVALVLHARETRLFEKRTQRLEQAVHRYFENKFQVDPNDLDAACVDSVRKLHPKQFWFSQVDEQWMIQACLRQSKFTDETKVQRITFDHAYPEYLQFLKVCKHNIRNKTGVISVPTKCQDVIWHSHMQDAEKYKADTIKVIGCLLNHMDDIPDDELAKHDKATREQVKNGVIQEKLVVA